MGEGEMGEDLWQMSRGRDSNLGQPHRGLRPLGARTNHNAMQRASLSLLIGATYWLITARERKKYWLPIPYEMLELCCPLLVFQAPPFNLFLSCLYLFFIFCVKRILLSFFVVCVSPSFPTEFPLFLVHFSSYLCFCLLLCDNYQFLFLFCLTPPIFSFLLPVSLHLSFSPVGISIYFCNMSLYIF